MTQNEELQAIRIYHCLKRGEALGSAQVDFLLDQPDAVQAVMKQLSLGQVMKLTRLLSACREERAWYHSRGLKAP
jgi:hypothetical protein